MSDATPILMPAAPTPNALTRALNSALATALTRAVILALPILTTVGLWAGHRYLAEQVDAAPAIADLRAAQTEATRLLTLQADRIRELEEARRISSLGAADVLDRLKRLDLKADQSSQQLNRLVGAFEARGIIPRQVVAEIP